MAALLVLVGTVSACTGAATAERTSAPRPDSPCTPRESEQPSKALLRCGDRSVAFIETPYATGTGVVIGVDHETYILTNLHVVDPYDSADVSVGGVTDLGRVPVVGADVAADIAILGPVEAEMSVQPLQLGDPDVEKGDDVFLIGFPGTIDVDEADLTITSGLVSRMRSADDWGQTYIQSDALIGHGQSGGPLFASSGEIVGISGLSFHDGFALALSIQDVGVVVRQLLADGGDPVLQVPQSADDPVGTAGPGATQGTVALPDEFDTPVVHLPPSDRARTWNLSVSGPEGQFSVDVTDAVTGELIASNAAADSLYRDELFQEAIENGMDPSILPDDLLPDDGAAAPQNEVSPGVFEIEVAAGQAAEVTFGIGADVAPSEIRWSSDLPLWPLTEQLTVTTLEIGQPAEGIVGGYQLGVPFEIDLAAGQRIEVSASSPQGDVSLAISPPGAQPSSWEDEYGGSDGSEWFDDSGEGLYGLDVLEVYTAELPGTYSIWLENYDYTPLAYRVEIRPG